MGDDGLISIVIDQGSQNIRAGFTGEDTPKVTFSNIVGRPLYSDVERTEKDYFVGNQAQILRGILKLEYPIERGIVTNWGNMEKIWHHTFYDHLKIAPEEHPIFVTDACFNPKTNREKITQHLFESFGVPACYCEVPAVLGIYASGRSTGIVTDIGEGVCSIVPIYEGYMTWSAANRRDFGGGDITEELRVCLTENGHALSNTYDRELVREIKERLCYVSKDYELDSAQVKPSGISDYTLPDGHVITLGSERFRCPEILFQPALFGIEKPGIHELIYKTIMSCDIDTRKYLWGNLVFIGGSTLFPGFGARIEKELTKLAPPDFSVRIFISPDRINYAWIGGSIVTSHQIFQQLWVSKEEYDESGPSIMTRKTYW